MVSGHPHQDTGGSAIDDVVLIAAFLVVGGLLFLYVAARAVDPAMEIHAWMFVLAFSAGGFALARYSTTPKVREAGGYELGVVRAGTIASMFWDWQVFWWASSSPPQLAFPNIFYFPEAPWSSFGRPAPTAHVSGHLRFRW